jgi:DNA-directed RNA polymerase specialized sigma24 family protein
MGAQLQAALERLKQAEIRLAARSRSDEFSTDLAQADLKQRLKGGEGPKNVPEKYRMVAAMARRGLGAADIAEILEISPGEADQLLKLVRVPDATETIAPKS